MENDKENHKPSKKIRNPKKHKHVLNKLNREKGQEYVIYNKKKKQIKKLFQQNVLRKSFVNAQSRAILLLMKHNKRKHFKNTTIYLRGRRKPHFC